MKWKLELKQEFTANMLRVVQKCMMFALRVVEVMSSVFTDKWENASDFCIMNHGEAVVSLIQRSE